MRVDSDLLRSTYAQMLEQQVGREDQFFAIGTSTLDAAIAHLQGDRAAVIDRFLNDTRYGHFVAGHFNKGSGYMTMVSRGISSENESILREDFGLQFAGNEEFSAGIGCLSRIGSPELYNFFTLAFPDWTSRRQRGVITTYSLQVPEEEVSSTLHILKDDPEIILDTFRQGFPEYDRSGGKLRLGERRIFDARKRDYL